MFNLFRNELLKLSKKLSTWAMVVITAVVILGIMGISSWVDRTTDTPPWKDSVAKEITVIDQQLAAPTITADDRQELKEQKMILQHRLDKQIAPLSGVEEQIVDSYGFSSFISLMAVIVAAGIVASEFSQGTIKMLLTRPVRRWKILTSKFLAVAYFSLLLTIFAFVITWIASLIFYDFSGGSILEVKNGQVVEVSYLLKAVWLNFLAYLDVLIIASFAFAIGSIFRSNSLAIGISIFLMFTGSQISFFLAKYDIVKYILFSHSFTQIGTGQSFFEGITTGLSVTVMLAYFILFLVLSFLAFTKRDVTA